MSQTISVTPPALHKGQKEVLKSLKDFRYVIVAAGRRWGKTSLSIVAAFDKAFKGK